MKLPVLLSVLYPVAILAVPGDPCSAANGYGDDCICVTTEICRQYEGNAITGSRGKYPCPKDPENVIGCVVTPCHNRSGNTQCLWRKACDDEMKVASCPGGKDFICCNHHLDTVSRSNSTTTGSAITSSGDTQASSMAPATTTVNNKTSTGNTSTSETTTSRASSTSAPNTPTTSPAGSSHTTAPATTTSRAAGACNSIAISEFLGGLAAVFAALR